MKKFKFLVVLMLLAVVPIIGAKAVEGTFNTYKAGDIVNFYDNDDHYNAGQQGSEDVGLETIILEDSNESTQYVRALSFFGTIGERFDTNTFEKGNSAYNFTLGAVEEYGIVAPYIKDPSEAGNMDLISLEELVDVFGATTVDGQSYTIDAGRWGEKFRQVITAIVTKAYIFNLTSSTQHFNYGFYTSTVTDDGNVWVVKFDLADLKTENVPTQEGNQVTTVTDYSLNAITVEKTPIANSNEYYGVMPVLYFDKTYDCMNKSAKDDTTEYACYKCEGQDDYSWIEAGTQAETCELVDTINTKSDCIKPIKTGINDYAIEVLAVLAIGTAAIIFIKKKSAFRGI